MTRSTNFIMPFESWVGAIAIALVFAVCAAGAYFLDGAVLPALLNVGAAGLAVRLAISLYRSKSDATAEAASSRTAVEKTRPLAASEARTIVKSLASARRRRDSRAHDVLST